MSVTIGGYEIQEYPPDGIEVSIQRLTIYEINIDNEIVGLTRGNPKYDLKITWPELTIEEKENIISAFSYESTFCSLLIDSSTHYQSSFSLIEPPTYRPAPNGRIRDFTIRIREV